MKAGDVMTRNVVSTRPNASVAEMVKLMLDNRISGLPVIDDHGDLVGIVTEGDCLRRAETGTERKRPRWLEFLIGPGRLADEYIHTPQSEGRGGDDAKSHNDYRGHPARRGCAPDGNPPHQAAAGRARSQSRGHCQPGEPAARPGQCVRQHPVRHSDRRGDSRSTHDRTGQAAVVAATQCDGRRTVSWTCGVSSSLRTSAKRQWSQPKTFRASRSSEAMLPGSSPCRAW